MGNELIIDNLSQLSIQDAESLLIKEEQVDCPVIHRFSPGLYIRELYMKAGSLVIGHEHKTEHFNVMLKGKLLLVNPDGTKTELTAPQSFSVKAGRKIAYIIEDTIWQNIHPTTETDINKLEEMFLNKSEEFKLHNSILFEEEKIKHEEDREDFNRFLIETGLTKEYVKEVSENEQDQVKLTGDFKFKLDDSPIQGKGIFATADIEFGELIGIGRVNNLRTQLGRFTNHSKTPNAKFINQEGNIFLVANKNISGCKGGMNGDEITVDYREALKVSEVICQE